MSEVERDNGKFVKGQSGNPGGRPKGLASVVRDVLAAAVADGEDPGLALVRFYARVYADGKNPLRDRMKAAEWLSDRGWGKAPMFAPIENGDPLDLGEVDKAIDSVLDELARRREAKAVGEGAEGTVEGQGTT